jgi:NADH-quinone oxidoreductase subunit C
MLPDSLRDNPIAGAFEDLAATAKVAYEELTIEIAPENIVAALERAKGLGFEQLTTVTAVDRYPAEPRFEVVYHLHSFSKKVRVRLKARLSGAKPEIETGCGVYPAANWYERETYDLFGVVFLNHPDLRRILLPDDWEGHPLRKDVPTAGTRY